MTPSTIELPVRPAEPEGPSAGRPFKPPFAAGSRDDWPKTNRWIPWLLAVFLVMLWLVPFDSTAARFDAPFDPKLDRFLISLIALAWIASVFTGGRLSPRWRRTPLDWAVIVFVVVAVLSVILNISTLVRLDEHELAVKKLSLLLSYATFFFVVATTIRASEIARFVKLFTGLAVVCACGVLYQKYVGPNLFFDWWKALVPDAVMRVENPPGTAPFNAPPVSGPAKHPLALALMLAIAVPFMLVGLSRAKTTRDRILYGIGFALLLSAVFATSRKTGSYASVAAILTVIALRPRELVRFIPHAVVIFTALLLAFPTAVEKQIQTIDPNRISEGASGENRKTDYAAIVPDVRKYPVVGRGYGTYDAKKYRILDNNYLTMLIEIGFVGVAAFAFIIAALIATAWGPIRSADPSRAGPALAAAGAAGAFAASMALFDSLAFAQGPYMLFFLGAVAVVAGSPATAGRRPEESATQVLPPLEESLQAETLPPLQTELEAERARQRAREQEREADRHAGGRPRSRPLPPSRRRAQPVREHVAGPLPGAPEPERRSPGEAASDLAGRARRAGAEAAGRIRRRTGTIFVGLAALAIGVLALAGGGGQPEQEVPRLGSGGPGDDPFGLDEFDSGAERTDAGRTRREDAPSRSRRRQRSRSIPVTEVEAPAGAPSPRRETPAGGRDRDRDRGGDRDRGRDRDRDRDRGRDRDRDREPEDPRGGPPPVDPSPEAPPRDDDCISPEVDPILEGIDIDACAADESDIALGAQNAWSSGRLSKAELDLILDSLRRARAARG